MPSSLRRRRSSDRAHLSSTARGGTPSSCTRAATWDPRSPKASSAHARPIVRIPSACIDVQVIYAVDGLRVQVDHLEALDGTPIVDVKPAAG